MQMRLKRISIVFLISSLFTISFLPSAHGKSTQPSVNAQAAILMDATTGRVLYAKNENKGMKIASLTKIMTAIIAIEQGKLTEPVKVSSRAVGVEGSSIYLKEGEKISLKTLLYGLMLRSGNDAAIAIAEHIGGSVSGFVYLMNEKAEHLGLTQTSFANPHGLDDEKHYSSAKDLAILTSYALKNPVFREIVQTEVKKVPWPGEKWHRKFYNKNKLLRLYKGADGVKTGYTKSARRTLVTSATKNGRQLVSVTLNDPNDWEDHMQLFNYGFSHFSLQKIMTKGKIVVEPFRDDAKRKKLKIVTEEAFHYPLARDEKRKIVIKPILTYPPQRIQKAGLHVGTAQIYLGDTKIGSVPLITKWQPSSTVWSQWKKFFLTVWTRGA